MGKRYVLKQTNVSKGVLKKGLEKDVFRGLLESKLVDHKFGVAENMELTNTFFMVKIWMNLTAFISAILLVALPILVVNLYHPSNAKSRMSLAPPSPLRETPLKYPQQHDLPIISSITTLWWGWSKCWGKEPIMDRFFLAYLYEGMTISWKIAWLCAIQTPQTISDI